MRKRESAISRKSRATVSNRGTATKHRGMAIVSVVYSMAGDLFISCLLFLLPIDIFDLIDCFDWPYREH